MKVDTPKPSDNTEINYDASSGNNTSLLGVFCALELVSLLNNYKKYFGLHVAALGLAVTAAGIAFFLKHKAEKM